MSEPEATGGPGTPIVAARRPSDLRLARIHLRMGAHDLARAELEAFAGAGALDPEALLDLAEVRWRTGDLAGAGVAAEAFLDADREDPVALAIAAEAAALAARYGDARRMAARTVELVGGSLDELFAGMPRSAVWPTDPLGSTVQAGALFEDGSQPEPSAEVEPGAPDAPSSAATSWTAEAPPPPPEAEPTVGLWPDEPAQAGPPDDAAESLTAARSAMQAGDEAAAADRLAELLRRRPDLAASVLAALDADSESGDQPPTAEPPGLDTDEAAGPDRR